MPLAGQSPVAVKQVRFTDSSSPLQFESYLSFVTADKEAAARVYRQTFFVPEIFKTAQDAETFWYSDKDCGDQFYIKKTTGAGKGFAIIGEVALLTAVDAVHDAAAEKGRPHHRKTD